MRSNFSNGPRSIVLGNVRRRPGAAHHGNYGGSSGGAYGGSGRSGPAPYQPNGAGGSPCNDAGRFGQQQQDDPELAWAAQRTRDGHGPQHDSFGRRDGFDPQRGGYVGRREGFERRDGPSQHDRFAQPRGGPANQSGYADRDSMAPPQRRQQQDHRGNGGGSSRWQEGPPAYGGRLNGEGRLNGDGRLNGQAGGRPAGAWQGGGYDADRQQQQQSTQRPPPRKAPPPRPPPPPEDVNVQLPDVITVKSLAEKLGELTSRPIFWQGSAAAPRHPGAHSQLMGGSHLPRPTDAARSLHEDCMRHIMAWCCGTLHDGSDTHAAPVGFTSQHFMTGISHPAGVSTEKLEEVLAEVGDLSEVPLQHFTMKLSNNDSVWRAGVSMEKLEEVLVEIGDAPSSPEDVVRPDSAELAAMEFGKIVIFSPNTLRAYSSPCHSMAVRSFAVGRQPLNTSGPRLLGSAYQTGAKLPSTTAEAARGLLSETRRPGCGCNGAAAGSDGHGARGPWQDQPAGRSAQHLGRRRRGGRHHAGARA